MIELAGQGGMAHYAFQLSRGLSHAGADVTLITRDDYELAMLCAPFHIEQSVRAMRPTRVGFRWRRYREWRRILRRIEALKPDVVIVNDLRSTADYWPLVQLRNRTRMLALIVHRIPEDGFVMRRMVGLFDRVFVHYERNRTAMPYVPESKIDVIVHGNEEIFSELADPTFTAASLRKQLGIDANEKVVLFFGSLAGYKGVDVLLRAFPAVYERTGARLVIAGHPTRGFPLESHMALSDSLQHAVVWVPEYIPGEHVVAWMQLASVIVFPYREVTHGGAPHIAQTYGVPTVATSVGAMTDIIEDGVSGLLVPPENSSALSDAIVRVLENESLARNLGDRLRTDARTHFSWDAIARGMLAQLSRPHPLDRAP